MAEDIEKKPQTEKVDVFETQWVSPDAYTVKPIRYSLKRWMLISLWISLGLAVVLFIIAPALSYLARYGINQNSVGIVKKYFSAIMSEPGVIFKQYSSWFSQMWNGKLASGLGSWITLLPFITVPLGLLIGYLTYPSKSSK